MIKMTKKKSVKEKSNSNLPSYPKKISKQKSKNIVEKKFSLSKSKLNPLKTSKKFSESKFNSKKNHNSISSKEEIITKFQNKSKLNKINQKTVYNNTCGNNNNNNNNKLFSSNLFLTNDTDIPIPDEEKKNLKKSKFNKNSNNQGEILNLPELDKIFKKNTFKKTIIIDNEGNNNLHLNIKKGENDYKILLNNNKSIFSNSSINANTETNSLFTNASKVETSNINNNNINNYLIKEKEIKKNIIDDNIKNEKDREEKRIKEYTKIFNLLNTNIEQFKKMFNNNSKTNNNSNNNSNNNDKLLNPKEKKIQKSKNQNMLQKRNNKILIQNKKTFQTKPIKKIRSSVTKLNHKYQEKSLDKNTSNNIKKNFSEKNLSSSSKWLKTNQNIFTVDVRNDIEKDLNSGSKLVGKESNNAISSFLESSLQDDFYQSLMNGEFPNLKEDDKIMKDDIISVNIDEKGKDENIQDVQNSRIFRGKIESENYSGDNNNINLNDGKNLDKNNCYIF